MHTVLRFFLLLPLLLAGCGQQQHVEDYTDRNLLVVSLEVEDRADIQKIVLISHDRKHRDSLTGKQLEGKTRFSLRYPQHGEGTYRLCVYTLTDTLCHENYIEGGYRPKLRLRNGKFETLDPF